MQRLAFAEANRFPELGRLVYEGGIRHVVAVLARYLAAAHQRGRLHCPDPGEAARHLSGLLLFDPRERLLLGIEPAMPEDDVSAYVERVVSVFLDGVRLARNSVGHDTISNAPPCWPKAGDAT